MKLLKLINFNKNINIILLSFIYLSIIFILFLLEEEEFYPYINREFFMLIIFLFILFIISYLFAFNIIFFVKYIINNSTLFIITLSILLYYCIIVSYDCKKNRFFQSMHLEFLDEELPSMLQVINENMTFLNKNINNQKQYKLFNKIIKFFIENNQEKIYFTELSLKKNTNINPIKFNFNNYSLSGLSYFIISNIFNNKINDFVLDDSKSQYFLKINTKIAKKYLEAFRITKFFINDEEKHKYMYKSIKNNYDHPISCPVIRSITHKNLFNTKTIIFFDKDSIENSIFFNQNTIENCIPIKDGFFKVELVNINKKKVRMNERYDVCDILKYGNKDCNIQIRCCDLLLVEKLLLENLNKNSSNLKKLNLEKLKLDEDEEISVNSLDTNINNKIIKRHNTLFLCYLLENNQTITICKIIKSLYGFYFFLKKNDSILLLHDKETLSNSDNFIVITNDIFDYPIYYKSNPYYYVNIGYTKISKIFWKIILFIFFIFLIILFKLDKKFINKIFFNWNIKNNKIFQILYVFLNSFLITISYYILSRKFKELNVNKYELLFNFLKRKGKDKKYKNIHIYVNNKDINNQMIYKFEEYSIMNFFKLFQILIVKTLLMCQFILFFIHITTQIFNLLYLIKKNYKNIKLFFYTNY